MARLIGVFSILVCFASCDPGYAVILSNNSGKENSVKVIASNRYMLANKDSIQTTDAADISFSKWSYTQIDIKDTMANSYSFKLEAGRNAVLQRGIGYPDMSQKIIIGNTDTILIQKKGSRVKIKRRWMSTSVMIKTQ